MKGSKKIEKLDSLFLFIPSLLGLIFTFFQFIVGNDKSIILFIPLTISILIIPIYIGYIRGSILLDSKIERVRGWLYLINCSLFYIIGIPQINIIYSVGYEKWFPFILILPVSLISIISIHKLIKIYDLENILMRDYFIFKRTSFAGMAYGMTFYTLISALFSTKESFVLYSEIIFYSIPLFLTFLIIEYKNRFYIENSKVEIKPFNFFKIFSFYVYYLIGINIIITRTIEKNVASNIFDIYMIGPLLSLLIISSTSNFGFFGTIKSIDQFSKLKDNMIKRQ